jgi:hypothetical protein
MDCNADTVSFNIVVLLRMQHTYLLRLYIENRLALRRQMRLTRDK